MKSAPKPQKKVNKTRSAGEADVFKVIWAERPHICEHCSGYLGEDAKTWFFAHIQRKSQAPGLRLIKINIRLLCMECHTALDNRKYEHLERLEGSRPGVYVGSHVVQSQHRINTQDPDIYQLGINDQ